MASSGAVLFLTIRGVSGVYQQGVGNGTSRPNDVAWLPSAQTPFGYVTINGQQYKMTPDPAWYRAFQHLFEVKIGGRFAPSLPDVVATVESTQAAAVQSEQQVGALTQQSQANAESLNVARQVLQNNALPGAAQIPPVVLSPYENIP